MIKSTNYAYVPGGVDEQMPIPPLHERLNRLVQFAHSRDEDPPSAPQIVAMVARSRTDVVLIPEDLDAAMAGASDRLSPQQLQAVGKVLGLLDQVYLAVCPTLSECERILALHDRFALLIEMRDLGVRHVATRDVDGDPRLIPKLRAALAAMRKQPSL